MKFVLLGLLLIVILIQIPQADRSNPPVTGDLQAPGEVKALLKESCYDCHSNETCWPWYSYVNPVGWLVAQDVDEGRAHLNFSEWNTYDARKQYHAKEEIVEVLDAGEMPLPSYLLLHSEAELTPEKIRVIRNWAQGRRD
ncbi:MAG: heme-binding domain-containing protein [Bacteroidota bacterium]|nr:heme-binding domain-containing protein [Bacteroidota bacterium]